MTKKKRRQPNPVARNMETFNRPATHRDRKKDQKRGKRKHKGAWPSVRLAA